MRATVTAARRTRTRSTALAWVDVRKEPVILSHPDMGDRFFTFELGDMSSDNFAVVGQNTTGSKAGNFAIVGPSWKGTLPADVRAIPPSTTPMLLILGRTLVDGKADVPAGAEVDASIQAHAALLWGKPDAKVPEDRDVFQAVRCQDRPAGGLQDDEPEHGRESARGASRRCL